MKQLTLAVFLLILSACQSGPEPITIGEAEARQRAADEAAQAKLDTDCPQFMKIIEASGERCKTAEELTADACNSQNELLNRQADIAYEEEIGKKAGFVNAGKIYQDTKDIDLDKFAIGEIRKTLKKKYHQKLNLKACPKPE